MSCGRGGTGQPPQRLTFAQADRAISALAAHFIESGLPANSVIALQLPNTIEFALTALAAYRAGLVVAALPLLWRQAELTVALNRTGARAVITTGKIDGVSHADIAMNAAAECFSIRHVCGFGDDLPEGMASLDRALARRILILDGAMGTMVQQYKLDEASVRGSRFRDHSHLVKNDIDLLVLTLPDLIASIHDAYLDAGADIIETNTFGSTSIAQSDFGLEAIAYELNVEAARLARAAADAWTAKTPTQPRFVAGAIGPTNRTLSISPDVNDPAFRAGDLHDPLSVG